VKASLSSRTFASITALAMSAILLQAQPSETLSPKDIADAIQLGTYGVPSPYLVHNWNLRGEEVNQEVLAVLYTPFLRVALAAKAATEKGITFEPGDVTDEMIAPVFYVAFRFYWCDGVHRAASHEHPNSEPSDYMIAEPGRLPVYVQPGWAVTAKPLWSRARSSASGRSRTMTSGWLPATQ
jgi:hypothetical protein